MKNKLAFLVAACCLTFFACSPELRSDYDYQCGEQLSEEELERFVSTGAPLYNFEALKLLGKISNLIFMANGNKKNYDVQFMLNVKDTLVVQVYGLAAEAAIDSSACAVFGFKDYIFLKETRILFYKDEKSAPEPTIVVGLRKK